MNERKKFIENTLTAFGKEKMESFTHICQMKIIREERDL